MILLDMRTLAPLSARVRILWRLVALGCGSLEGFLTFASGKSCEVVPFHTPHAPGED